MTESRTRRLAAVWFADIVGYTELSATDEDAALAVVDEFQRLVREAVGEKGRVVKFLGDGALSIFDSTSRALDSATRLRDAFEASPVARAHGCTISVGVHMGEVVAAGDGDVYGDGVNIASRVEGVAAPGQVLVSDDVYRLIRNRSSHRVAPAGEHVLKGLPEPMPLYALLRPGEVVGGRSAAAVGAVGGRHATSRRAVALGTLAGVVGFTLLGVFVASTARVGDGSGGEPQVPETSPTVDREPTRPPPAGATEPTRADGLAVLVFSEGPGVQAVEQVLSRSLGTGTPVRIVDAGSLGLTRQNEGAIRAALRGDVAELAELVGPTRAELVVLGGLETSATRAAGGTFSGSAQLGLRMYRVSTRELVQSGTFAVGGGRGPAVSGPSESQARTEAARQVARRGAVAARGWLQQTLR